MSKIDTEIYRSGDRKLLRVQVSIDWYACEKCILEFRNENYHLAILSTSTGAVVSDQVVLREKTSLVEAFIEYTPDLNSFDCLISYLNGNKLVHFETLRSETEDEKVIKATETVIRTVHTSGEDYNARKILFSKLLSDVRSSAWKVHISIENDLVVRFIQYGAKAFMAFGEISEELLSSDFIFPVDKSLTQIIIPKEVVWKSYDLYSIKPNLGCYEIVKADFHSAPNLYYKVKASNVVELSQIPRQKKKKLDNFTNPFGEEFGKKWSLDKKSMLPRFTG